jgi:glutaminase
VPGPEHLPDSTRRRIHDRLHELHDRHRVEPPGKVESYYRSGPGYYPPSEAGAERQRFAISIATVDGHLFEVGDTDVPFPLHSISKVFTYGMALADHGPAAVLEKVGVEPSGEEFNALIYDKRHVRPFNPMVNAGALVTTSLLAGETLPEQFGRALEALRTYAGRDDLDVDLDTLRAEMLTADGNRGVAYLMRSAGMLDGDVESVLRLYLEQCSVMVTSGDLALMAATLANGGAHPRTGRRALPRARIRDVLSVMHTCGMYDYAGHWAFDVGFPAKSGVSGGILAVVPGKMGIGVFSPGLDVYGNSVRGVGVCGDLSERLGLHVFATEAEDELLATENGLVRPEAGRGADR